MLIKPSVTPKNRSDYLPAYAKEDRKAAEKEVVPSTVRFNAEVHQIRSRDDDANEEELDVGDHAHESGGEDFPPRPRPVKGRKATGLLPNKGQITFESADEQVSMSASDRGRLKGSASKESLTRDVAALQTSKSNNKSMASKMKNVMGISSKPKRSVTSSGEGPDDLGVGLMTLQDNVDDVPPRLMHTACMSEAFAPVFAEGIATYSPKATYNAKNKEEVRQNLKSMPMGKHALARLVESARTHSKKEKKVDGEKGGGGAREKPAEIGPAARSRLMELAKSARVKAQEREQGGTGRHTSRCAGRDEETDWGGTDFFGRRDLLQDARELPSLILQPPTPLNGREATKEERRYGSGRQHQARKMGKSVSRSRVTEQEDLDEEVFAICGSCEPAESIERRHRHEAKQCYHEDKTRPRSRSRSRSRQHSCSRAYDYPSHDKGRMEGRENRGALRAGEDRQQRRTHHSSIRCDEQSSTRPTPNSTTSTSQSAVRSSERVPDKRRGKVIDSGTDTQRLNMALNMARTRMEMELAEEEEEMQINTRQNAGTAHTQRKEVKDEEERAWLEEAYEEAIKKEVEYRHLYDAHSIGAAW